MAARVLQLPLRIVGGRYASLPQGSDGELAQSVAVLLRTERGSRVEVPRYGVSDPTFRGVDVAEVRAAIAQWEPRALADVSDGGIDTSDVGIHSLLVEIADR